MGRKRKNSQELARPRQVVAPVLPLNTRPRRSTKDAFYNNLSTLTATRKTPIEDEMIFEEKVKVKPKRESVGHRKSSSSVDIEVSPPVQQRPVLVRQQKPEVLVKPQKKPEVVRILIPSSTAPQRAKASDVNGLHHFIAELRRPHFSLSRLEIETVSIDPRMQYSCNLCSRRFPLLSDLNQHLSQHVENIYSCALCEKPAQGFTMEEYTQHLSSHFLVVITFFVLCFSLFLF
uniref:C2H2-type domain-containing protein n=1 Tax=Panagrolaimus superbus TaxID=310955 RepID=A0A914YTB0_9BILA